MSEPPLDPRVEPGIPPERLPRHIAIIMDGNGRWAQRKGLPRMEGHACGARSVRAIVTHCARLGVQVLTLYCFSTENWKRPREEIDFLMDLYARYLVAERPTILDNNVRFRHVGRREGLSEAILREMDTTTRLSAENTGLTLCLALNYGSRDEILDAVRKLAQEVKDGTLEPDKIDDQRLSDSLYTTGLPDPDLLIRTAGERRVSNFLLWQISYAELYVSEKLWPDFTVEDLNEAIRDYAARERRFGDVLAGDGKRP